jgi:hypothetical protein
MARPHNLCHGTARYPRDNCPSHTRWGPSWLRVVIERARENRATVEVELMSSTSHEVCELWNRQKIVRTIRRPEIQQIVYLDALGGNRETLSLYTVESAEEDGYLAASRKLEILIHVCLGTLNPLAAQLCWQRMKIR